MIVAHGGTAGAIAEVAGLFVLAGLFLAVWLRNRRLPDDDGEPSDKQAH